MTVVIDLLLCVAGVFILYGLLVLAVAATGPHSEVEREFNRRD